MINALYHYSPRTRLRGINRQGLMPGKRNIEGPTLHDPENPALGEFRQPCVCLSLDPATAWAYSHGSWGSTGVFDLWQLWPQAGDKIKTRVENGRVVEVRIFNRIHKRRLHWIGERTVEKPVVWGDPIEVGGVGQP